MLAADESGFQDPPKTQPKCLQNKRELLQGQNWPCNRDCRLVPPAGIMSALYGIENRLRALTGLKMAKKIAQEWRTIGKLPRKSFCPCKPKGPFRTKSAKELESVVFCYRRCFSASVPFSSLFPRKQACVSPLRSVCYVHSKITPAPNSLSVVCTGGSLVGCLQTGTLETGALSFSAKRERDTHTHIFQRIGRSPVFVRGSSLFHPFGFPHLFPFPALSPSAHPIQVGRPSMKASFGHPQEPLSS